MDDYPVTDPTKMEKKMFDAELPVLKSWKWLDDNTPSQWTSKGDSEWTVPEAWNVKLDVHIAQEIENVD